MGERIRREWVLPIFIVAVGLVACLLTFPYETLAIVSLAYLALIPLGWRRYNAKERESADAAAAMPATATPAAPASATPADPGRVIDMRSIEPKR
jgi:CDP-diacylglycerol--serine O-phosphatidyltransferase